MNIAICDDDPKIHVELMQAIKARQEEHDIQSYFNLNQFSEAIEKGATFDVLLLDIEMPEGDGWHFAKQLRESDINIYTIMISYLDYYIYRCFDRVDWFLPKPIDIENLYEALDKAQERLTPKEVVFDAGSSELRLKVDEIVYIEVIVNKVLIHTASATHELRTTLKNMNLALKDYPQFVQTHKSYVMNLFYYRELDQDDNIVLYNKQTLRLSRSYKKAFMQALLNYTKEL